MKKAQPTYSLYTRQDMDALYGTRPATSTTQTVQCPDGYVRYTIRSGDTLRSIASAHGITVTELLFYNPELNPYGYRAGDRICVPGQTEGDSTDDAPAQPDDAQETPSAPSQDEASNETETPEPPADDQSPEENNAPECENGVLYTVRAGDTLRSIAQRFEVTLDALMSANPGQTNYRLIIGQQLCIPRQLCSTCCPAGDTAVRIRSTNFVDYLVTYNISFAALSAANPDVDLDSLIPGLQLCIPPIGSRGRCSESAGTLELPQNYTPAELAEQLRISIGQLMRANPTYRPNDFIAGRIICVPPSTY